MDPFEEGGGAPAGHLGPGPIGLGPSRVGSDAWPVLTVGV
jgi:hypothetical protein